MAAIVQPNKKTLFTISNEFGILRYKYGSASKYPLNIFEYPSKTINHNFKTT
jgi:hypothetical protein